ncbi:MAG TPA: hypothetical protein VLM37_06810, partial [Fibrobacteraceae bacterium]|nr:hypothetical protein [Fibrobacteraceae bacterium]
MRLAYLSLIFFGLRIAWGADRVVGANLTLGLDPSAQAAGFGDASLAIQGSALTSALAPVGMLDMPSHAFGVSHTEHYEDTWLDALAGVYALDSNTRLGLMLMRFGADDIPWIPEGSDIPEDEDWDTFSIADYVLSLSAAHRIPFNLDVSLALHFLYRELDQTGYGFRGDAMARWRPFPGYFLSAKLEGWTSSVARWESGELEYSPPDVRLASGYCVPVPYLYGVLSFGYQSAGVLHRGNRAFSVDDSWLGDTTETDSSDPIGGERAWDAPWS